MKTEWEIQDFLRDKSFINWVHRENPEDTANWDQWLKENPHATEIVDTAKHMIIGIPLEQPSIPPQQIDAGWDKLQEKLLFTKEEEQASRKINFRYKYYAIAAILLLLVAIGWTLFYPSSESVWVESQTAYGEQKEVVLPDGSKIKLNANSSLRYLSTLGEEEIREVFLEGEAFFEVRTTSDLGRFLVHAKEIAVEVTGTSFNVNTHFNQPKVSLEEGKVTVWGKDEQNVEMEVGTTAIWDREKNIFSIQANNNKEHIAWRFNKWIFDHSPLEEVFTRLSFTYGLSYEIKDADLLSREVSGDIALDNQDDLIDAIAYLFDVNIKRIDERLIISKKP